MRRKREAVLAFESNDDGLPKVVRDYRARYRTISQVLDENPKILDLVHEDLKQLSNGDGDGREGDYTSENILRALVVQDLEGLPFRDAVIRIGSDLFLQNFARMRKRAETNQLTHFVIQRADLREVMLLGAPHRGCVDQVRRPGERRRLVTRGIADRQGAWA